MVFKKTSEGKNMNKLDFEPNTEGCHLKCLIWSEIGLELCCYPCIIQKGINVKCCYQCIDKDCTIYQQYNLDGYKKE